jgi:hypothetical protein
LIHARNDSTAGAARCPMRPRLRDSAGLRRAGRIVAL